MSNGGSGGGGGGGAGGGATSGQKGRAIYKLGTHRVKIKNEQGQTSHQEIPILSRALRRVGQRLQLDEATEQDIRTIVQLEGGNAEFYKRGALAADRIKVVYEEAGQDGKTKVREIQIPIPSWAPNYRLVKSLAAKARAAGLKLRGIRRHGYLITPPAESGGGGAGGGGGGG